MTPKIRNTKILKDGQKIYILDSIYPRQISEYMKEYESDVPYGWNSEQQGHHAMRSFIKHNYPELTKWLVDNDVRTTNWVDPEIFKVYTNTLVNFPWGIGFKPNDPIESFFVLCWS